MAHTENISTISARRADFETLGRVEINVDTSAYRRRFLILTISCVLMVLFIGIVVQEAPVEAIVGVTAFVVIVVVTLMYWMVFRHQNKSMIVEADSLTLMDGFHLYWKDVEGVSIYVPSRSLPTLSINVNEEAWSRYLSRQNPVDRAYNRLLERSRRKRLILVPSIFEGNLRELATWLNQFSDAPVTNE